METASLSYVVISPVKDEARNIERVLDSMVRQNVHPLAWFIVDDGSSDRTAEIAEGYAAKHAFIRVCRLPRRGARATGVAEVLAFNHALPMVAELAPDCIVKLDGDLSFDSDYFQRILEHFARMPQLGIASGVYLEDRGLGWQPVDMPGYHAAGASKVIRWRCFEEIGGFIAERGWDTVDEIRAMASGWETRHFPNLRMRHWKPEGEGMGQLRTCSMHGEIFYRTRGGLPFFVLKVLRRIFTAPWILGSIAMAWGYARAALSRQGPLISEEQGRHYRALLGARLFKRDWTQVIRPGVPAEN